jgi:hypothetical protein
VPALRSAQITPRAAPPAPSTSADPGAWPMASSSPPTSVLSAWIDSSSLNVSVLAAPAPRAASVASSATASASSLCGIVTFAPR